MNKPKNIYIYLAILFALIIFFLVLPSIVDHFNITEGAPLEMKTFTLEQVDSISYSVDRLDPITVNGQKIFYLWGWSFLTTDIDQTNYEIYVLLRSEKAEYYYLTESFERPDLHKAFPEVEINLDNSGFKAFVAKEKIQGGQYDIGIIYRHKSGGSTYYHLTNKQIIRTPNTFSLVIKQ